MSCSGLIATMTVPEPTDGDIFLASMEQVLCPSLLPGSGGHHGQPLAAHKVAGVQQLIASAGATLVYLPPYSPDLNPIDQSCWAKIKEILRSAKARSAGLLEQAIAETHALHLCAKMPTPGSTIADMDYSNPGIALAPLSSTNTSCAGSMASTSCHQLRRFCCAAALSCSSACSVFFTPQSQAQQHFP